MSWVCPICSTNNEDTETKCFVCDYNRKSDAICTLTKTRVRELDLSGDVIIPEKFNIIGAEAFKDRTDIISVIIPSSVRKISKEAFSGCLNLKNVVTLGVLKTIGMRAFSNCISLTKEKRPSAQYIAEDAFAIADEVNKDEHKAITSMMTYCKSPTTHIDKGKKVLRIIAWLILMGLGALVILVVITTLMN